MKSYALGPFVGNIFLVILFLQALLNPTSNKDFIENTSGIYFITELFSLAGCLVLIKFKLHPEELGMTTNNDTPYDILVNKLRYFSIAFFFIIGALLMGYITHAWFIPLLFSISLISKAYSKNFVTNEKNITIYAIIFGISYVFIFFSAVVWGIIYYGTLAFFELYSSYKYIKRLHMKVKSV
jgi:hypothetical protein